MNSAKRLRISFATGLAVLAALLLLTVSPAAAQPVAPFTYLWDGGNALDFWDLGSNWNIGTSEQANNAVPFAYFEEMGHIGPTVGAAVGPFTVHVRTAQDTYGTSTTVPTANRRSTAGVTVDLGSTLNIQSTGILKVVITNGLATETGPQRPGTGNVAVNAGSFITVQTSGQLIAENDIDINSGSLTVFPGGSVTGQTIDSGAAGAIILSGNAALNSPGSTTLNGRTTITGPSVTFNSIEVAMGDTTIFNPVITGASHSIMNINGPVTMNGTLRPQFSGVTPTLASSWVIWDSASTGGAFDVSDDSLADLPTGHRYAIATTTVGSLRGTRGLLTVENFLTAEVNRANGQVTLRNTAATGGVTIEGYQITSAAGVLGTSAFTSSLADDGFDGGEWVEANLTAGNVGELNAGGNSLIATSSSNLLGGRVYDPIPTLPAFGDPVPEDLVLTYRRSDGRFVTGEVTYTGDGVDNTLVLQVDPTDGKARIVNDSVFDGVQFDSYRVSSADGSLRTTWNSLDDQNLGGADAWLEAAPSANALSELNSLPIGTPGSAITVDAGETAAVMTGLFNTGPGFDQDLVFEFRAASPTAGAAVGDYNENGTVDAADYTVWRNMLGQAVALPNEDPSQTPNSVTSEDYLVWKNNFGSTGSSELGDFEVFTGAVRYASFSIPGGGSGALASPVPEPSTFVLAVIFICGLLATCNRSNYLLNGQRFRFVPASSLGGLVS